MRDWLGKVAIGVGVDESEGEAVGVALRVGSFVKDGVAAVGLAGNSDVPVTGCVGVGDEIAEGVSVGV